MKAFNLRVKDSDEVKYYSFGASTPRPGWGGLFRASYDVIAEREGDNDGLVSIESAIWGEYKGTIPGVNHLDIINWVEGHGENGLMRRRIGSSIGGRAWFMARTERSRALMLFRFICMLQVYFLCM